MNSSTCTSYSSTCTSYYYHTNLYVNLSRYCWKTTSLFTPSFLLYFVVFLSCWPARFNSKNGSEVLNSQVIWYVSDTSKSSLMLLHRIECGRRKYMQSRSKLGFFTEEMVFVTKLSDITAFLASQGWQNPLKFSTHLKSGFRVTASKRMFTVLL